MYELLHCPLVFSWVVFCWHICWSNLLIDIQSHRSLSDVDGDGRLTSEEFSLAMHLVDCVRLGQALPLSLPPNLVPPSMRTRSRANSGAPPPVIAAGAKPAGGLDTFGDLVPGSFGTARMPAQEASAPEEPTAPLAPLTLEDKRRENFAKGGCFPWSHCCSPSRRWWWWNGMFQAMLSWRREGRSLGSSRGRKRRRGWPKRKLNRKREKLPGTHNPSRPGFSKWINVKISAKQQLTTAESLCRKMEV